MNLKSLIFLVALLFSSFSWSQTNVKTISDSVSYYISKSKEVDNSFDIKLVYGKKSQTLAREAGIDSILLRSNLNLSTVFLEAGIKDDFLKLSHQNLKFSEKVKDTAYTALISKNIGDYYDKSLTDSAYYYYNKSLKLYKFLNDKFNSSVLLLDVASIQRDEKDYTGSEINSIEGISLLESLKATDIVIRKKAYHYNNLGMVLGLLDQYDTSIKYYKECIRLVKKLEGNNDYLLDVIKNNLALVYGHSKQYDLAINIYESILDHKDMLIKEDITMYALALDNYAYTLFLLNKQQKLPKLYFEALKSIDTIKPVVYESIAIYQHLAEYYHDNKKGDSAKYYAYKAKEVSEKYYYNDDVLKSLLVLLKVEDNDSIAIKHYNAYIKLNDSLLKNERRIRNKFERIRFETNQIEQENAQIEREKLWLMLLSGILLITALLIYIVVNQRNKNKELKLIQQQQEANEEIYNLMLSQQDKVEEARSIEKKRVSQELHDGVLGRLFGTRLSLDSLNMNTSPEAIKTRGQYIDELKTIEQDIRKVSHELNTDFVSGSGFVDIIKTLVITQTEVYKIKYELKFDDSITWEDVSNKTKIHVYRIVQETLHNIHKHAQANLVTISFELKNSVIWLTINDDGVGFDVDKAKKGIGIKNIKSRVNEIEGILYIKSEKDQGTTIIITISS